MDNSLSVDASASDAELHHSTTQRVDHVRSRAFVDVVGVSDVGEDPHGLARSGTRLTYRDRTREGTRHVPRQSSSVVLDLDRERPEMKTDLAVAAVKKSIKISLVDPNVAQLVHAHGMAVVNCKVTPWNPPCGGATSMVEMMPSPGPFRSHCSSWLAESSNR